MSTFPRQSLSSSNQDIHTPIEFSPVEEPTDQTPLALHESTTHRGFAKLIEPVFDPLIQGMLGQFSLGRLTLIYPNGQRKEFGHVDCDAETRLPYPQATLYLHQPQRLYRRMVTDLDIGFAESYMAGEWDTPNLTDVLSWFIWNINGTPHLQGSLHRAAPWLNWLGAIHRLQHKLRQNTKANSRKNIMAHYDLSNDFFRLFLDSTMTYSSAKFRHWGEGLDSAQKNKMDALCQHLQLQPGDSVLEIGSGWGAFACHMAEAYGCQVKTITVSEAQLTLVQERIRAKGLEGQVSAVLQDYRDVTGQFDKIVSVEMIEAVGDGYLDGFFQQCARCLKPHGLLALQMILCPDNRYKTLLRHVDFIQKYIFPGSLLPSWGRIHQALAKTDLSLVAFEDLGLDYGETLRRWERRFQDNLSDVQSLGFSKTFCRMWTYYLRYCEAAFDTRNITVVQSLFSRPNNPRRTHHTPPHPKP